MSSPTTDSELLSAYHALVKAILSYDNPSNWPLSDEARIWFVRRVMGDAKVIADSEPFLRSEMIETLKWVGPHVKVRKSKN